MDKILNYLLGFILIIVLSFIATESTGQNDIRTYHKIVDDKVALRAKPMKNSKRLAVLNTGDEILFVKNNNYHDDVVDGIHGVWVKANFLDMSGYVFDPYLSKATFNERSDSNYFYVVDTSTKSIGISNFKSPNWYIYQDEKLRPSSAPNLVWGDSSHVIHYNNSENMIATNLYLASDLNLSRLFSYNQIEVKDTFYNNFKYKAISNDTLLIESNTVLKKSKKIILPLYSNAEYLHHNIESLIDLNGDGVLDILLTVSSNYEQNFYFLISQSGNLDYSLFPITFKNFPYEGC